MIPYSRQTLDQLDIDAVLETLKSDFLTQGPKVPEFENALAKYCGVTYALAVNSGTSALHIACLSLGVKSGDIVWTSPITFVASANCALYCGADIDFVDIDPLTGNLSAIYLEEKLIKAEKKGLLPKVVIPVHMSGHPCDMEKIHSLSLKYGFKIIEDASHALGAEYKSGKTGSCKYSDITVFSFHPVKMITTGEGGMVVTNDESLYHQMNLLRSHGITRDSDIMTEETHGEWYYQQIMLGYNYRMTDIQAALGKSQLDKLDKFVDSRRNIARKYDNYLKDLEVSPNSEEPYAKSSYHLYIIKVNESSKRSEVFKKLRNSGVGVNVHYIPVHTQPFYQKLGFSKGDFPMSESYYTKIISLPIYPLLKENEQKEVASLIRKFI